MLVDLKLVLDVVVFVAEGVFDIAFPVPVKHKGISQGDPVALEHPGLASEVAHPRHFPDELEGIFGYEQTRVLYFALIGDD